MVYERVEGSVALSLPISYHVRFGRTLVVVGDEMARVLSRVGAVAGVLAVLSCSAQSAKETSEPGGKPSTSAPSGRAVSPVDGAHVVDLGNGVQLVSAMKQDIKGRGYTGYLCHTAGGVISVKVQGENVQPTSVDVETGCADFRFHSQKGRSIPDLRFIFTSQGGDPLAPLAQENVTAPVNRYARQSSVIEALAWVLGENVNPKTGKFISAPMPTAGGLGHRAPAVKVKI